MVTLLAIREMQTKALFEIYLTPVRMAGIKEHMTASAGEDVLWEGIPQPL